MQIAFKSLSVGMSSRGVGLGLGTMKRQLRSTPNLYVEKLLLRRGPGQNSRPRRHRSEAPPASTFSTSRSRTEAGLLCSNTRTPPRQVFPF